MFIGTPEGEERENGTEEIFEEIMTGNVLRFGTNTKSQIQKVQRTPCKTTAKRLHIDIYSNYRKSKIKGKKITR